MLNSSFYVVKICREKFQKRLQETVYRAATILQWAAAACTRQYMYVMLEHQSYYAKAAANMDGHSSYPMEAVDILSILLLRLLADARRPKIMFRVKEMPTFV